MVWAAALTLHLHGPSSPAFTGLRASKSARGCTMRSIILERRVVAHKRTDLLYQSSLSIFSGAVFGSRSKGAPKHCGLFEDKVTVSARMHGGFVPNSSLLHQIMWDPPGLPKCLERGGLPGPNVHTPAESTCPQAMGHHHSPPNPARLCGACNTLPSLDAVLACSYREGMSPVVCSSSQPGWERMPLGHVFYYRSPRHNKQ